METRICKKCGEAKIEADFPQRKIGKLNTCTICFRAEMRDKHAAKVRDKAEARMATLLFLYHLEYTFGGLVCGTCGILKDFSNYYMYKDQYKRTCKQCYSDYGKQYKTENKDACKARSRSQYQRSKERLKPVRKAYYEKNKEAYLANWARRHAQKLHATVAWADLAAIKAVYKLSAQMTEATGILHHVDHIIPLQNELVCGLHVETNLQVITAEENRTKSNSFEPGPHWINSALPPDVRAEGVPGQDF